MDKVLLYGFWRSSCSWRVRIALNWKGVDYDYKPVNHLKGEHRTPEYLEVNPRGLLPALAHGNTTITESVAIMEYLEEKLPDTRPLLPGNAEQRALIRSLALQIVCNIQPLQNTGVLNMIDPDIASGKRLVWASHWIERGFDALEKQLAGTSGKYCVGDAVTMADACLVPQVQNARRYGVDVSKWPTILRVDSALSELPEFRKAHAYNQLDTPDGEKRSF